MKWLLIFVLSTPATHANTVLFQGRESRALDYQAALKAHSDYVSPAQEYIDSHPSIEKRQQLLELFSVAQKAFLDESEAEARRKFRDLLELLGKDDWSRSDREIFLQAYLRLAQMEAGTPARDHWLGLSLLLGDEVHFDPALFPPPLLARRSALAASLAKLTPQLSAFPAGWTHLLLNGEDCDRQSCVHWPRFPGTVRVTFLSEQWQPQTFIVELNEIAHLRPKTIVWAEGDCNHTKWHQGAEHFSNKKFFPGSECQTPAAIDFKPAPSAPEVLPVFSTEAASPPFYQSKWLWIGVGTLATILLIANSQAKKEVHESGTTYGY